MARDLNKVMLTGRLGADPEGRYTPQGSAVTTFRVASNRAWKTSDGEQKEDTEWFSIVAWNKLAEICNQYLTKGSRVYIEGRSQTRSWEDATSGQTRYKTEVIASEMIILDGNGNNAGSYSAAAGEAASGDWDDDPAPAPAAPARRQAPTAPAAPAGQPRGTNYRQRQPFVTPADQAAAARRKPAEDDLPF